MGSMRTDSRAGWRSASVGLSPPYFMGTDEGQPAGWPETQAGTLPSVCPPPHGEDIWPLPLAPNERLALRGHNQRGVKSLVFPQT